LFLFVNKKGVTASSATPCSIRVEVVLAKRGAMGNVENFLKK
jgi:hypothetical protein